MRPNPVPDNVVLFIAVEFPDSEFWFGPGDAILCLLYTSDAAADLL